jgi:hypothetical protein
MNNNEPEITTLMSLPPLADDPDGPLDHIQTGHSHVLIDHPAPFDPDRPSCPWCRVHGLANNCKDPNCYIGRIRLADVIIPQSLKAYEDRDKVSTCVTEGLESTPLLPELFSLVLHFLCGPVGQYHPLKADTYTSIMGNALKVAAEGEWEDWWDVYGPEAKEYIHSSIWAAGEGAVGEFIAAMHTEVMQRTIIAVQDTWFNLMCFQHKHQLDRYFESEADAVVLAKELWDNACDSDGLSVNSLVYGYLKIWMSTGSFQT